MVLFLLTLGVIAVAMLIMAVGLAFRYPCLRGSCGGAGVAASDGTRLSCEACPRRREDSPAVGGTRPAALSER
ncbi:MAG: hypothetical protein OXH69_20630 [Acidobacteria bacterium]|nr:hypothetical protein [Acidobacteriota bacterium]